MIVYKFGGASVKDVAAIKNLVSIVKQNNEELIIVVSALDKTTNRLEKLLDAYYHHNSTISEFYHSISSFHNNIVSELFPEHHSAYKRVGHLLDSLHKRINILPTSNYDYEYSSIVSFGELLSTIIISEYLNYMSIQNLWIDIRDQLICDDNYVEAHVDIQLSEANCNNRFNFKDEKCYVTQGFIAGNKEGESVTLGREGSDYSAALLASFLNANTLTVWKDVSGVYNADPKWLSETERLDNITYREAIELAFSGAKVIHHKTIKPLFNKHIPLVVRSFLQINEDGTTIEGDYKQDKLPPIFIRSQNQALLTISPRDYSFAVSDCLDEVFDPLRESRMKVNLIQSSAISISVCVDNNVRKINQFVELMKSKFKISFNTNLELITVRHFSNEAIDKVISDKRILIEQRTRRSARFVVKST